MYRTIKFTLQITVLLLVIALYKEVASQHSETTPGWSETQRESFGILAQKLQPALSSFLGRDIVIDKIVYSIDNCCDVADYHPFIIFARIQDQNQKSYYSINAYIGYSGDFTVSSAERTNRTD